MHLQYLLIWARKIEERFPFGYKCPTCTKRGLQCYPFERSSWNPSWTTLKTASADFAERDHGRREASRADPLQVCIPNPLESLVPFSPELLPQLLLAVKDLECGHVDAGSQWNHTTLERVYLNKKNKARQEYPGPDESRIFFNSLITTDRLEWNKAS